MVCGIFRGMEYVARVLWLGLRWRYIFLDTEFVLRVWMVASLGMGDLCFRNAIESLVT